MLEITVGTEPLEGSFFARSVDSQNATAIADIHIDLGKSVDDRKFSCDFGDEE